MDATTSTRPTTRAEELIAAAYATGALPCGGQGGRLDPANRLGIMAHLHDCLSCQDDLALADRQPAGPPSVDPDGPGRWSAEASTLGLAPGQWPDSLLVRIPNGQLVNFRRVSLDRDQDGDVRSAWYSAAMGTAHLTVWND
jgi:hypothetical protein